MGQLSFKVKLLSLCSLLCLMTVIVSAISYIGLNSVKESNKYVVEQVVPKVNLVHSMALAYRKIRIEVRTLGLSSLTKEQTEAAIERTKSAVADYEALATTYEKIDGRSEEEQNLYAELKREWVEFKAIGVQAIGLASNQTAESMDKLIEIFTIHCPVAAAEYQIPLDKMTKYYERALESSKGSAEAIANKTDRVIIIVSVVGIIAGLAFGFFFAGKISKTLTTIAKELGEGAEKFSREAEDISHVSESLSESTVKQASSVQETSATIEEISSMVNLTAENSRRSSELAQVSFNSAMNGKSIVAKMSDSMALIDANNNNIMNQVNLNNEQMQEIVSIIHDIGEKTKVINDIVFQTKLLSFNASVEAARAGNAGKGFAVVAEEVGKLAAMSGEAAVEISQMLNHGVSRVNQLVGESSSKIEGLIETSSKSITTGNQISTQCSQVLDEIVRYVTDVTQAVKEISSATDEQAKGVSEIKEAVRMIDEITHDSAQKASSSSQSAEGLFKGTQNLKELVQRLLKEVDGKSLQVKVATSSSENVIQLSQRVRPVVESFEVSSDDKRFKEI